MGVVIESPASNGWKTASRIEVPFAAAWEGFFSFGVDAKTSIRNLIAGKTALSAIGALVYGENYVDLTGAQNAYFLTDIINSSNMTIIATAMPLEEKGIAIASNYQSTRQDATGLCIGTSLGFDVGSNPSDGNVITRFNHATLVDGVSTGAAAETSVSSHINQWYLVAGRCQNSNRVRNVYNLTAGTSGANTPQLNPVDIGGPMRLGSAYNNQFPGKVRICELAIFSESLSDANFATLIQFMRKRALTKGIAV